MTQAPTRSIDISLQNITKAYQQASLANKRYALNNLSLEIPKAACTGIIGPNGAGKTTTIRLILGLIKPDFGKILFRGFPIRPQDRNLIGYMSETNKFPKNLSCEELLYFHLKLCGTTPSKERIAQTLDFVGLSNERSKPTKHLSKGMARRLAWAQATIHHPELIILDEPFSGLDPIGRHDLKSWIEHLRQQSKTIILCTHEIEQVPLLCDDIYILKSGTIAFSSKADPPSNQTPADHFTFTIQKDQVWHQNQPDLPSPSQVIATNQGTHLIFKHQADSFAWLKFSIEHQLPFLGFHQSSPQDPKNLLKHFTSTKDPK